MKLDKKCYLHIGAPKTGSTALQYFLYENRRKLAEQGWIYPEVSLRGFGHHDLAFLLGGGYPEWAIPQEKSLSELANELQATVAECSQIILSSENFYLLPNPQKVAQMLFAAGFPTETVKIVVYIRRQDEAHISWYNQVVKAQGYSGTIDQCIQDHFKLWDYQLQLGKWAQVFERKNILIRPYEEGQLVNDDIRKDFLRLLNLSQSKLVMPDKVVNTRLNRDILEFQRIINHLPLSSKEKRAFHKEMIDLTICSKGKGLFNDNPLLSFKQRKEIISKYSKSNKYVAREYMDRLNLFGDDLPHFHLQNNSSAGLNLEKLIHIFGWIMIKKNQNSSS